MSNLGQLLRAAALEQELSNRQLAERAGLSSPTVDRMMNGTGRPKPENVEAVARALGIPVGDARDAAGLPRGGGGPYTPPAEANLLGERQRRAVDELIRSVVAKRPAFEEVSALLDQLTPEELTEIATMARAIVVDFDDDLERVYNEPVDSEAFMEAMGISPDDDDWWMDDVDVLARTYAKIRHAWGSREQEFREELAAMPEPSRRPTTEAHYRDLYDRVNSRLIDRTTLPVEAEGPAEQASARAKTGSVVGVGSDGQDDAPPFRAPTSGIDGHVGPSARDTESLLAGVIGYLRQIGDQVAAMTPKPDLEQVLAEHAEYATTVAGLVAQLQVHLRAVNIGAANVQDATDAITAAAEGDQQTVLHAVTNFQAQVAMMIAAQGSATEILNELLPLTPVEYLEQLSGAADGSYEAFGRFIRNVLIKGNEDHELAAPLASLADSADRVARDIRKWSAKVQAALEPGGDTDPVRAAVRRRFELLEAAVAADAELAAIMVNIPEPPPLDVDPDGPDRWPSGEPVYDEHWEQWKAWREAGAPAGAWEAFRASDVQQAHELVARFVEGPTDAERLHRAQDEAGEAPNIESADDPA